MPFLGRAVNETSDDVQVVCSLVDFVVTLGRLSKWATRKSWQVRQDEWKRSGNLMATVKPNIRRYSSNEKEIFN
jgi:hypothetical protein